MTRLKTITWMATTAVLITAVISTALDGMVAGLLTKTLALPSVGSVKAVDFCWGIYQTDTVEELDIPAVFEDWTRHKMGYAIVTPAGAKYICERLNPLDYGINLISMVFGYAAVNPDDPTQVQAIYDLLDNYILNIPSVNRAVSAWLVHDEPEGSEWNDHRDWAARWVSMIKEHDPQHRKTCVRHSRISPDRGWIPTGEDEVWAQVFGFGWDFQMWGEYHENYADPNAVTTYIRDYALPELRVKFGTDKFVAFGTATYIYWVGGTPSMDCKAFTKEEYLAILNAVSAFPSVLRLCLQNYYGKFPDLAHDQSFCGLGAQAWEAVAEKAASMR